MEVPMSQEEIKVVRWVEKILTPLLVLAVTTLATCSWNTQTAIAQLKSDKVHDGSSMESLHKTQQEILKNVQNAAVERAQTQVNQDNFKTQIKELKEQQNEISRSTTEILRVLNERR